MQKLIFWVNSYSSHYQRCVDFIWMASLWLCIQTGESPHTEVAMPTWPHRKHYNQCARPNLGNCNYGCACYKPAMMCTTGLSIAIPLLSFIALRRTRASVQVTETIKHWHNRMFSCHMKQYHRTIDWIKIVRTTKWNHESLLISEQNTIRVHCSVMSIV